MTTAHEEVVLIDFLRNHASIGCGGNYGSFTHFPELCPEERAMYWNWETELRAMGGAAEDAYQLMRDVAKLEWKRRYGEYWHGSRLLEARVIKMLRMTTEKTTTELASLIRDDGAKDTGRKQSDKILKSKET